MIVRCYMAYPFCLLEDKVSLLVKTSVASHIAGYLLSAFGKEVNLFFQVKFWHPPQLHTATFVFHFQC